jgi:Bacterial protein of unknown function (HtrL_YibB)
MIKTRMFRRHRPAIEPYDRVEEIWHRRANDDDEEIMSSRELIIVGQNHIVAFLIIMYILIAICRLGWGWSPGRESPIAIDMTPLDVKEVTIVTSFFCTPSKTVSINDQYKIRRFLNLHDNMIIFSTETHIPYLQSIRTFPGNSKFINVSLEDVKVVKDFGGINFWQQQEFQDPQLNDVVPDKLLYILRNSKGDFLEQAIALNPFETEFFIWVDMTYFHDSALDNNRMIRFLPKSLSLDQVFFLNISPHVKGTMELSGQIIGGYKNGLSRWIKEYYTLLHAHEESFLGNEQPWLISACLQNPGLCFLVQARDTYGNPEYFMAHLLHGMSQYGVLDNLQHFFRSTRLYLLIQWSMEKPIEYSSAFSCEK